MADLLVTHFDRVAVLTLNRPEHGNRLTTALANEVAAALEVMRHDAAVSACVLTGAGDAFCLGGDYAGAGPTEAGRKAYAEGLLRMDRAMAGLGKPLVAAVNGHAHAGGFATVVACDLAVAADDATFGLPEAAKGLFPFIALAIVKDALPKKLLFDLVYSTRLMDAAEARAAHRHARTRSLLRAARSTGRGGTTGCGARAAGSAGSEGSRLTLIVSCSGRAGWVGVRPTARRPSCPMKMNAPSECCACTAQTIDLSFLDILVSLYVHSLTLIATTMPGDPAMKSTVETRLAKIRSLSKTANLLCVAAITITCLLTLFGALAGVFAPQQLTCTVGGARVPCSELSAAAAVVVLTGATVGVGLLLKGLYHLSRLFRNYSAGEIFTRGSVGQIRKLGETVLAYAIFEIILVIGATLLTGIQDSPMSWPADRPIPIPFASFIAGALIILIARVMEIGTELREENELTV